VRARRHADDLERQLAETQRRLTELERELERSALRDPLTGLPTPTVFFRHVETEVERSRRHGTGLSLAVLVDVSRSMRTGSPSKLRAAQRLAAELIGVVVVEPALADMEENIR